MANSLMRKTTGYLPCCKLPYVKITPVLQANFGLNFQQQQQQSSSDDSDDSDFNPSNNNNNNNNLPSDDSDDSDFNPSKDEENASIECSFSG